MSTDNLELKEQACHLKSEDAATVFRRLNEKFSLNFNAQLSLSLTEIENVEMRARGIATIPQILVSHYALTATQKEICAVFDEVFADIVTSVYLAGCALDKPARMVLRRALELGTATMYLWDQPHLYWGWKHCDSDLSYKEILEYLDSECVKKYISNLNPTFTADHLIDVAEARSRYRDLSNTVHGKISHFETQIQDRFSVDPGDWSIHLENVICVQNLLFRLWFNVFPNLEAQLKLEMPQLAARM